MLPDLGRRRHYRRGRAREPRRLAQHLEAAELRVLDRRGGAEMAHLRIGEHLVDTIDRPAGHARAVEDLDPFGARLLLQAFVERGVQARAVLGALLQAFEVLGLEQVLAADGLAQPLPHALAGRGTLR